MNRTSISAVASGLLCVLVAAGPSPGREKPRAAAFELPRQWQYSAPLISPEKRDTQPSVAQKDPTCVFHSGKWHVFMTVKLKGVSAIEYCSFATWAKADQARRTVLKVADSTYYCAPQVFYFVPHRRWYLIYQQGVPGARRMRIAFSTTTDIADPASWTKSRSIFRPGQKDPRKKGGLDYWVICDRQRAYLFFTTLNGQMWRMHTRLADFPHGFGDLGVALRADIFEASHIYTLKGVGKYLNVIEANPGGRRYYKAYLADRLDGKWTPLADSEHKPFAGAANVRPLPGVPAWADNISHGELIRAGNDQTLTVDPKDLRFVFQGALQKEKAGKPYGLIPWRLGMLTPITGARGGGAGGGPNSR